MKVCQNKKVFQFYFILCVDFLLCAMHKVKLVFPKTQIQIMTSLIIIH